MRYILSSKQTKLWAKHFCLHKKREQSYKKRKEIKKMVLYHGTVKECLDGIKKERKVRVSSKERSQYSDSIETKYGWVYLTEKIFGERGAIDFASRNYGKRYGLGKSLLLYVISVELPEEFLEIDEAETDSCYKYGMDIPTSACQYCELLYKNFQDCCDDMDYQKITKDICWKVFE